MNLLATATKSFRASVTVLRVQWEVIKLLSKERLPSAELAQLERAFLDIEYAATCAEIECQRRGLE